MQILVFKYANGIPCYIQVITLSEYDVDDANSWMINQESIKDSLPCDCTRPNCSKHDAHINIHHWWARLPQHRKDNIKTEDIYICPYTFEPYNLN